jgi:hypothetical protein
VFAVADIWLRIGQSRHLLVSELHTGNLVEVLKVIERNVRNPTIVQGVEKIIPCGRWGAWMSGYWKRLADDVSMTDDERTYELLRPMSLMEGREGQIAAYKYNGVPIIEASTRPENQERAIYTWSRFDPEKMTGEVRELRRAIELKLAEEIRQA